MTGVRSVKVKLTDSSPIDTHLFKLTGKFAAHRLVKGTRLSSVFTVQ